MQRREFIGLLGTAALSFPRPGYAETNTGLPLVGYLSPSTPEVGKIAVAALRIGLQAEGFIEGVNYSLATRFASGDMDRLPVLASELAALSLIRPSATCGHLGDVVGDKLIYDAPTAHGASGGPVFNSRGEVIGVNAAYIDGFSGGTLGVSSQALKPLIEQAQKKF